MISTRNLTGLPDIEGLRRLLRSMAMLDAILCPEWQYRYYSFNSRWAPERQEEMGSMRDGCGNDYFALFDPAGCFLKGFDHETAMSPYLTHPPAVWPGVLDAVPSDFASGLNEPAFKLEDTTFCIWRKYSDRAWQVGPQVFPEAEDPDGSGWMLSALDGHPETYHQWAEGYYEQAVSQDAVRHIYAYLPLTAEIVTALNPGIALAELEEDLVEIAYPV